MMRVVIVSLVVMDGRNGKRVKYDGCKFKNHDFIKIPTTET